MDSKPHYPTARDFPSSAFGRVADGILNLVYPEKCLACSVPVARQQDCGVCGSCWQKAIGLEITPPWCPSCGIPFQSFDPGTAHLCGECTLGMPPFSGARSFGYYRGELSKLAQALKFDGRRNLAGLLCPLLARTFVSSWDRKDIDLIVPVPLHPRRRRERGYNQAAVLARGLSRLLAVPAWEGSLRRVRLTLPQVGLTDAERETNVRGAFACPGGSRISRQRILLVDDVMTTGATVRSAAQALLDGGALRVSVLTLARAVPGIE